jgi:hypothetical protein
MCGCDGWACSIEVILGPALLQSLLRLGKGTRKALTPAREECNKYDLIVAPCF